MHFVEESELRPYFATVGFNGAGFIYRTGGEARVSNFPLWQFAIPSCISHRYWPEFDRETVCQND